MLVNAASLPGQPRARWTPAWRPAAATSTSAASTTSPREQLERSRRAARSAACSRCSAPAPGPGKTNVMARARRAASSDRVARVRCASAGLRRRPAARAQPPRTRATLLDELTVPPMVVRDGEPVELEPMTDGGDDRVPRAVGERPSLYTLHSEVLTLPDSLRRREADFRLVARPRRARRASRELTRAARRRRSRRCAPRAALGRRRSPPSTSVDGERATASAPRSR